MLEEVLLLWEADSGADYPGAQAACRRGNVPYALPSSTAHTVIPSLCELQLCNNDFPATLDRAQNGLEPPEPQPYIGLIVSNPWNHSRVWRVYTVQCAVHLIFSARCTCTVQQHCTAVLYSVQYTRGSDSGPHSKGVRVSWVVACFL
jgi:hypothetical protein